MYDYDQIYQLVKEVLEDNKIGHSMEHIDNVIRNSKDILSHEPHANSEIVELAALLHDVDDHKIVGREKAELKENSKRILSYTDLSEMDRDHIITICSDMGYSNYLNGVRPKTLEGQIVSDADMMDAMGANGILRSILYMAHDHGTPIFDPTIWPRENLDKETYQVDGDETGMNHFFEKLLLLRDLMFTDYGHQMAEERHHTMFVFLEAYFKENGHQEWITYLDRYR